MSVLKNIDIPSSLKTMALELIKEAILSQRLKPGEIYNEKRLAEELGISKTPVREALLELSAKGFIVFLPRRGVRVEKMTEKDIRDLYEVRRALEMAIIRCIVPKINKRMLDKINAIHKKGDKAFKDKDNLGYLRIDREFHFALSSLTENPFMVNSLENIRDLIDWMGARALVKQSRMSEVQKEHEDLIRKIGDKDLEGAVQMIEQHIRITEENVLEQLKKEEMRLKKKCKR
jgi:DNA-binding GntR family transcriptional regulator